MPYIIAFIDVEVSMNDPYFVMDLIVDSLFFWDIVINLNCAIVEGDEEDDT